ncbi:histidine phosphatase family protein [Rhodococcus opacus]|uniref:Phosphoglycerate mutase family protein n=1 Tax=Rhodococcus opacus (strain B4) TaxID=632772 RepID=C1B3P6_RHOOB|nr:histidine phosphatase family protein [Rhodococcus opacus]BAH50744.1 phosphoglycerate mutase family protein [Rhodococcus opacus B4]
MELVLVRHAEPDREAEGPARANPRLSDRGREQAARVADYLAAEEFAAIYTSPLIRAADTAAVIGTALGLRPIVRSDLAEFDRDATEYLHFEDLRINNDPRYEAFLRDDLSAWGTDVPTFRRRVTAEFDRIIDAHAGGRVLVVSHGGVANAFVGGLIGASKLTIHEPGYTGFARIRAGRTRRTLVSLNETPHLRGFDLGIRAVRAQGA